MEDRSLGASQNADRTLGVYLHVPFCERVCPYCDFAVVAARRLAAADEERYVAALLAELEGRAARYAGRTLSTIYFGGGTPALLTPGSIARLLDAVRSLFPGEVRETTLEANPSTLERERLPAFRAAGVDRLSLGVQSFDDTTLRRLGRAHRAVEAERTIEAARAAGFANLSIDLIVGAPGQTLEGVERDLALALAAAPEHLSVYALTLEAGTPFAKAAASGRLRVPDDDRVADMLALAEARLGAAGFVRYEVSNYARPGFESRHNQRYWQRRPVLGVGVGAHASEPADAGAPFGARTANERSLPDWLARIEAGRFAPPEREILSAETARGEAAFLALRTRRGLDAARFAAEFGGAPRRFFAATIDALVKEGLVEEHSSGDLVPGPRGLAFADDVAARFVGS
ncbi:MAG: radical SAM family heme chaperone HemW [Myxococcota bacterium]